MKKLRILTGAHSGAQVTLVPGVYRLGGDDGADVCITDWTEDSICIELDSAGVTRWTSAAKQQANDGEDKTAAQHESTVTLVPDLVPIPVGEIVLCFGPETAQWPADVDLLRMLWVKPEEPEAPVPHALGNPRAIGVALAGGMIAAVLVAGATLFGSKPRDAQAMPSPEALATRIGGALHAAGLADLQAVPRGNAVVVQGMVATAAEDVAARGIFAHVASDQNRILRQYDVGETDRRNLEDALAVDGTHVKYRGDGVFEVDGAVDSMSQFQTALARVKRDLDTNIKHIDVAVSERPAPLGSAGDYTALIAIGDVRYVETPDGVKHLYPGNAAVPGEPRHAGAKGNGVLR
ncbi:type III secretion system protein [Trinickia acidisoli]|uniref:type III secretion system protein n=1 Tax=Trinickia acidisoli TaxID=2767482 RepID=UPI001A90060F|nr:type III secretion system protein [Trinickia acidisoli]